MFCYKYEPHHGTAVWYVLILLKLYTYNLVYSDVAMDGGYAQLTSV